MLVLCISCGVKTFSETGRCDDCQEVVDSAAELAGMDPDIDIDSRADYYERHLGW